MRIEIVPNSKHPGIEAWIDFVRDSLPAEQAAMMRSHLGQGCLLCSRMAALWKQVWRTAQEEARFRPPEGLVRSVEASAAQYLPYPRVRLLFDSWREPLPAMIRTANISARHLIYQAGPVLLDLETQREDDRQRISVVGQLLTSSEGKKGMPDVPIQVSVGETLVAEATTNQFGEFHLRFDYALRPEPVEGEFPFEEEESIRLRAVIAHGEQIDLPLQLMRF